MDYYFIGTCLWIFIAVVWIAGSFFTKQTIRKDRSIRFAVLIMFVTIIIIQRTGAGGYFANTRFVPDNDAWKISGLMIQAAGIAIAIWARFHLGSNWSGIVTLKQDHELITSGPYSIVRHPIYTGAIVAMMGYAILHGKVIYLLMILFLFIGLLFKIRREEKLMTEQFADVYTQYAKRTKRLIPFIY